MTIEEQIRAAAADQGVNPDLAVAVARKESGFNQAARGRAGEIGVFQLMPGTAAELGVNAYDLADNIRGGVRYLKEMLDFTGGDTERALAAYNGGPGNLARGTVSDRAWAYARDVLASIGIAVSPRQGQASAQTPGHQKRSGQPGRTGQQRAKLPPSPERA